MKISYFFLLILLSFNSFSIEWTLMKLDIEATLRSERNNILEKELILPKNTELRFAIEVGRKRYRNNNNQVTLSRKGWYRYILLENVPGLTEEEINILNKKKLYISKTVSAGLTNYQIINTNESPSLRIAANDDSKATEDEKINACDIPTVDSLWKERCVSLFDSIPNDALLYSLNIMKLNATSFKSNKCYKMRGPNGTAMAGVTKEAFLESLSNGLPNKCQFIINDTRDKLSQCRGRMYYIDLCNSSKNLVKDYFNIGTGTCKKGRGFRNYADQNTTVLGAFFTNYKAVNFYNQNSRYNSLRSKIKQSTGRYWAPALMLFGLQNTNNNASLNGKYMHVSPYVSSFGCPSVSWQNSYMIEELAKNGPSLMVNYGHKMEDIQSCSE